MVNLFRNHSTTAVLAALGTIAGAAMPLVAPAPATAQTVQFSDVSADYWAQPYIERLATEEIIAGFPDGTFQPSQPVTRAQFAAIVRQAFNQNRTRSAPNFGDVPANYWASPAIADAYAQGFMSGYPNGTFRPEQQIPRVQAIVSLANGLGFSPNSPVDQVLNTYRDASQIPEYAESPVAAATENDMVVSYPDVNRLQPAGVTTRAEVAAFIYQALVAQGQLPALDSNLSATDYIVGYTPGTSTPTQTVSGTVQAGTLLPVRYPGNNNVDIVVAPGQVVATSLEIASPIRNDQNQVIIPAGSTVQGRFEPVEIRGSNVTAAQFVGDTLTVNGRTYNIDAESSAIAASESVNAGSLEDALITGAAESILGSILGNRDLGSVVGTVIGGDGEVTSQNAVIVINPSQLDLTLDSALNISN
jgi:hypothetical protein